ncbi:MAG: hypothetical protein ABDH19_00725 [Thermodesulfovibrio sp.]
MALPVTIAAEASHIEMPDVKGANYFLLNLNHFLVMKYKTVNN